MVATLTLTGACTDPDYSRKSDDDGGQPVAERDATSPRQQGEETPDASTRISDASGAAPDASTNTNVEPDTGVPASMNAGEPFRLGKYALLLRFGGNATTPGGGTFAEEFVVLADVTRVNNGLQMTWKTCAYNGRALVLIYPALDYGAVDVSKWPVRTLQLALNGNTFQTLGDPALVGYEELGESCPSGSTQSHPDRVWLNGGTCQCPTSPLLPTSPSDCRVTDLEGDGLPGFTVAWKGGTDNRSYSRIKDSSQLLNGVIAPDGRHTANLSPAYDNYQLGCDTEPCSRYPVQVCPAEKNAARFLPLDDKEWSCTDVVKAVDNSNHIGLGALSGSGC